MKDFIKDEWGAVRADKPHENLRRYLRKKQSNLQIYVHEFKEDKRCSREKKVTITQIFKYK